MFLALASVFAVMAVPPVSLDYANFRGLQVKIGDIAVIESSGFQYYEKGWKRGYFSSSWKPVEVTRLSDGSTMVRTNSDDGNVAGTQIYKPTANGYTARAEFRWRGDAPAMLEFSVGRIWSPFFVDGSLEIGAYKFKNLSRPPPAGGSFEDRLLGRANRIVFEAPSATIEMTFKKNVSVLDARNYSADWAKDKELFWVGYTAQLLTPQSTATYEYSVVITPSAHVPSTDTKIDTEPIQVSEAFGPHRQSLPLFPTPKSVDWHQASADCHAGFQFDLPESLQQEGVWLTDYLSSTWIWKPSLDTGKPIPVITKIQNLGIAPGGYTIEVNSETTTLTGQDEEGLRNSIRTLALLVRPKSGRLSVPSVTIRDWPSCSWRGVHMFVGPQAKAFQGRLIDRVLALSKLNKAVLQCERVDWESVQGIRTPLTMSKSDFRDLVQQYRSRGFEFIPLIQSLGHAEWFFANGQNLDLAVNPKVPYTIDTRRARSKTVLDNLWKEVAREFQPKTVHFGLDEVNNRGFDDEFLATRLWTTSVPLFTQMARDMGAKSMFWGDMMLHSSEAPDATNAKTKESAQERRAVIPRGSLIGDWHYKDDPNPSTYTSLRLWKNAGMFPVASSWFRPNNIRGQALATIAQGGGHLQTTWAGYESNEANMVKAWDQFSAYLLAAEYAWSGRQDMPDKLNYDAGELLQRLFYGERQPVSPVPGYSHIPIGARRTTVTKIGPATFRMFEPIQLFGVTTNDAFMAPLSVDCPLNVVASEIMVALDCLARANDATKIGLIEITTSTGEKITQDILYGTHVRAITDRRAPIASTRSDGASLVRLHCEKSIIKNVRITAVHSAAGLRLRGVTTF